MLLVNVATFSWATNMTLARWFADSIGPITLAATRLCVAIPLFLLLLQWQPPEGRRLGPDRKTLLIMALTGVVIFGPLLYLGLHFTTTVNATLINGFGPLVTGLLAGILIREAMSRHQVLGAIAGLAGVILVISGGSPWFWTSLDRNIGDFIVLTSVVVWALYSIAARQAMRHRSALSATALSSMLGLPVLLLGSVWELRFFPVQWGPELALLIVYLGVVPMFIGVVSWNEGVRRLGPSGAMVFFNTLPLYGALLGFLLLREPLTLAHLLGGALIIGGGIWGSRRHK